MLSQRREGCSCGEIFGCVVGILVACQAMAASPGSAVLLDFKDDAQFAQIHVSDLTKIEPTLEAHEGKRAARVVFSPVPEGLHDYPAVVIEGNALKIQDFSPFEAISLWVKNAGSDDAELSLSVRDNNGNRAFPIPSTVTIKPGRWEQVVSRLVLHGLDAKQITSVHFYQKVNRQPVTLLIADVQLLSPLRGRSPGKSEPRGRRLNIARANATALGAIDQIEPKIAALTRGLDEMGNASGAANTASAAMERLLQLSRISAEAQALARSIEMRGANEVVLTGPLANAAWLNNPEKVIPLHRFTLSNTSVGDELFGFLAPAKDMQVMFLESRKITGAGLEKMTTDKLRRLVLASTGATDDGLKEIGKFASIQRLELDGTNVTSGVLPHLEGLKQLKILSLAGTQVSDTGFAAIGKLTSLESLDLKRTRIHGPGVLELKSLTRLKTLDLRDTQVDDSDLSQLGQLTQLESLSLENTPITGAGFGELKGLVKLTALNFNRTRVGDSALRQFGKLPQLQRLELSSTRVTDGGLTDILAAAPVKYLDLFGTNITDAGLAVLQGKQGLQALYLTGTQTSDVGLSYLQNLKNLQVLDLAGTQITDVGLQYLQGMKLVSLKLGKTRISGPGLKHLAGLAELRVLDLSGTSVTDDSLLDLAPLKKLQTLLLSGTRVTSNGMNHLQGAPQLVELQLEATEVADPGVELLASLPNLQRLNLNETAVTNEGLKHLKKMGKLTVLSLSRTRVNDQGLLDLGDKYVDLDLSHTRITNQGVEQLQRCSQLSKLRLASTAISNDALKMLQVLPGLTRIDLAETAIDDVGLQYLMLLPNCKSLISTARPSATGPSTSS